MQGAKYKSRSRFLLPEITLLERIIQDSTVIDTCQEAWKTPISIQRVLLAGDLVTAI